MTPKEYAALNNLKPLSKKELKRGKNKIKIYGTDKKMPWTEVYTRIQAGMKLEHIADIYGNIRQIVLWAIEDNIEPNAVISDIVDELIVANRKINEVEAVNPTAAMTMKEMVHEYAPDVAKNVVLLANSMVMKGQSKLNSDECTTNDMVNIAKAVQTMTDTVELTQRHSAGVNIANASVQVQGFEFVLDSPPEKSEIEQNVIDVEEDS